MMLSSFRRGLLARSTLRPVIGCRYGHMIAVHRNTPGNDEADKFEFNKQNLERAKAVLAKYPPQYKKAAVMPLLDLGQRQAGFTSIAVMNYVAKFLNIPPMRVYEVASFYTMYQRKPVGKYHVQVCTTTPCQLCNSDSVIQTVMEHLGIHPGQTTADGLFSLEEVECLGACVNAPMLAVNDDYYEDLDSSEKVVKILDELKAGKQPAKGTTKRESCEPFSGVKTLKNGSLDLRKMVRDDL